ncbi:MAG: amidohydrolase [Acidobacteria bacterium]|nr:amidohydrolase [Acidobacteriota bacterium]
MLRKTTLIAALVALAAACVTPGSDVRQVDEINQTESYDLLVKNATIVQGAALPVIRNGFLGVRDGRVAFVGSSEVSGESTLDAGGNVVLPGLIDAHAHIAGLGAALDSVDLVGTESWEEVIDRLRAEADRRPDGEWITGRGWDQNDWPVQEFPNARELDEAIPDHPVVITRVDGHALVANAEARRLAGVTELTQSPDGGMILRDAEGRQTGVFVDNAMGLVRGAIPEASREVRKRRLQEAALEIARHGITGMHDAGTDGETIELLRELDRESNLAIRVYVMLTDSEPLLETWFSKGPLIDDGRVTVRSVKLYADGALGSRGAALLEPYSDADHTGLLTTSRDHMEEVARRAKAAGFQVGAHAIGDAGVRTVIEAFDRAGVEPRDRFRIEHLQVMALEDIGRIADLGLIASMQPTHATSDMPWAEARVGPERIEGAYAWRKVLDRGIPLALGSDFPVEEVSPFLGLYAAITRQDLEGHPPGGWYPEERLTRREALEGFTEGAAFAAFQEDELGTLEPGKLADFIIVDRNPLEVDPGEVPATRVLYTVVGGRVEVVGGK